MGKLSEFIVSVHLVRGAILGVILGAIIGAIFGAILGAIFGAAKGLYFKGIYTIIPLSES